MPLLKEKTSKMGSVVGFFAVTALIVIFSLALPEFFLSTTGRMFAVIWASVAIAVCLAHGRRISLRRRRARTVLPTLSTKRSVPHREKHVMRG